MLRLQCGRFPRLSIHVAIPHEIRVGVGEKIDVDVAGFCFGYVWDFEIFDIDGWASRAEGVHRDAVFAERVIGRFYGRLRRGG